MNIDIIISADDIKSEKVRNKTAVVIDVLRASTVIVTALKNGCAKVIPVLTVEEALEIAEGNPFCITGGERNALKIEGFDAGNSPLEYTEKLVNGKTLVLTTTNGTKAVYGCKDAKNLLIGTVINAQAVAQEIIRLNNDVVLVNAGTRGDFSIDDFIAGGYIVDCLLRSNEYNLTDIARTAHMMYQSSSDILNIVKEASHYKRLCEMGLLADIKYCLEKDTADIVPQYVNGALTLHQ